MSGTGDLLYSSGANTLARLGIGSTDDVLTVAGGVPTWASAGGGGGKWTDAGSDIETGYTSELQVTGITPADVYQIIVYGSDDSNPTGENARPKIQLNNGSSTYDSAFLGWTTDDEPFGEVEYNQDCWSMTKVSNKHTWFGVVYVWAYNGNFSNSYQDGIVMRGNWGTTAWNGTDVFGQTDATTDITSVAYFQRMDDNTRIDVNGSIQVNTLTYT